MSAPEGIRTPNLLIRSQVLYPLSYGRNLNREPSLAERATALQSGSSPSAATASNRGSTEGGGSGI
jgi:hypothetical protein